MIELDYLLIILSLGVFCGVIPLIAGLVKGKIALGIVGFLSCILSQALLGLILAAPVCLLFLFLILKNR